MQEFLLGWKRKIGVVTMVMAGMCGAEYIYNTLYGRWDLICPVDWLFLRPNAVFPLSLLSAYLLLSKPRRPNQSPIVSPERESVPHPSGRHRT